MGQMGCVGEFKKTDYILLVVRIAREQEKLELLIELFRPPLEILHLLPRHLTHLSIVSALRKELLMGG